LLSACAQTHEVIRENKISKSLNPEDTFYIAVPKDGKYGEILYGGSGIKTASTLSIALSKYTDNAEIAEEYQDKDTALSSAKQKGYTYLFRPRILHWEDRATEWSGRSDKVSISIGLYEVSTGKKLDKITFDGKSPWATWGGDRPEDLLIVPMVEYADSLFTGYKPIREVIKKPEEEPDKTNF
jgi:hypothetical protein